MDRLGRNNGRYHGETIDIDYVQREALRVAEAKGWISETFFEAQNTTLQAFRRPSPGSSLNLYLSSGIHGDEPSGPLALLELLKEDRWPEANLWVVPCLNPDGFRNNTRENAAGVDLNRDYRHLATAEVSAHARWLEQQPRFDLCLLLHEDWESNGFYVYELNPDGHPTLAEPMVEAVRTLCPIETAEQVDTFTCEGGIIRPQVPPEERPQWAEAIYLLVHKSRLNYTLETPSDYELSLRIRAHLTAVREAFRPR